jgi:hypothetical protein
MEILKVTESTIMILKSGCYMYQLGKYYVPGHSQKAHSEA